MSHFIKDKTIPQGAATTLYACVCPRVGVDDMRGAYLVDCARQLPTCASAIDESGELREEFYQVSNQQLDEALKKLNLL